MLSQVDLRIRHASDDLGGDHLLPDPALPAYRTKSLGR